METQLNREAAELKTELLKRIDALESYIKQEIKENHETLTQKLLDEASADLKLAARQL